MKISQILLSQAQAEHAQDRGLGMSATMSWRGWLRGLVFGVASALAIGFLAGTGVLAEEAKGKKVVKKEVAPEEARPILAIWRKHEGRPVNPGSPPYLRVAIWEDGRIVFAKDPTRWGHDLMEGKLEPERVTELKKSLVATGVFDVEFGTAHLVPGAPSDCEMLAFDGKLQRLGWDERETPNYGINIKPDAKDLKFMAVWKEVNKLSLAAIPKDSKAFEGKFAAMERSWVLKRAK